MAMNSGVVVDEGTAWMNGTVGGMGVWSFRGVGVVTEVATSLAMAWVEAGRVGVGMAFSIPVRVRVGVVVSMAVVVVSVVIGFSVKVGV
jgi:hypothetical protein